MSLRNGIRSRRLEPATQRLKRLLRRLAGAPPKRQKVHLVEIGPARLKRVVTADSCVAQEIADNLQRFASLGIVPRLIARYRNELWVEYIEGTPLVASAAPPVEEIARLFATLYTTDSRLVPRGTRDFLPDVERDVAALAELGIVQRDVAKRLAEVAAGSVPAQAWVGHDYNDPRPQNFLRTEPGVLRIVDVESIAHDALIGVGAARAWLRWPGMERERFVASLRAHGAPDFTLYLSFLEVAFLAAWTKRCALHRKTRLIDHGLLARVASRG